MKKCGDYKMFEEEIQVFKDSGEKLNKFDYGRDIREILDFILSVESDLFRARCKAERTINYRRF